MKQIVLIFLILNVFYSCSQGQKPKNTTTKIDKELFQKIDGEWSIMHSWTDDTLIFKNKLDKNFKQEIFPTFNTIVFNKKDKTIIVNTYGEFGCGTASIENLEIQNSKWDFENGQLNLKFEYSDYSGNHKINNLYKIERKAQTLTLKKIK